MQRESQLASRLLLMVGAFAALFLLFGFLSWRTLESVRVKGPIYNDIILGNVLIADILPPPAYIIESYLISRQIKDEADPTRLASFIARGEALRLEYETRSAVWKRELDGPISDLMNVASYKSAVAFFRLRDEQYIPAIQRGDRERAIAILAQMDKHYEAHRLAIDGVVRMATERNAANELRADNEIAGQRQVLILLAIGILVVVFAIAWFAQRNAKALSGRLRMAGDIASSVAGGDLSTEVPAGAISDDEAGRLLGAIQQMTASLRGVVTRVKQASIELMSTATEYAATSRQQESTVQSFGASTNQIAAAVRQISATSSELLATMEGVNVVAGQTANLAEQGQEGLRSLDSTMERMAQAANTMAARLAAIREEAAEITGVVTTISKVADQTNLLSINAAIEAEKAGEQGLGFLVLAREIRRLADQTAVATLDIEQMVKQMQNAVSAGVMEIDRFAEEVKSGVTSVVRVGGQFGQIIGQVRTLSERFDAVNDGMRSQSMGARQIGEAMGGLMDGARQTSQSLHEFNSATESLRDAVMTLKQEIAQFKVGT